MNSLAALILVLSLLSFSARDCSRESNGSNSQQQKTTPAGVPTQPNANENTPSSSSLQRPLNKQWDCSQLNTAKSILGVTISDIDRSPEAIPKLRELANASTSPVVTRLVFDPITGKESKYLDDRLKDYVNYARAIHEFTCVIGEIGDSHDLYNFFPPHKGRDGSALSYEDWTRRLATKLNDSVDIWEIGNELNGGWTGWKCRDDDHCEYNKKSSLERLQRQKDVMDATRSSYNVLKELKNSHAVKADALTALTLYYNQDQRADCAEYPEAGLNTWLSNPEVNISLIARDIDLVFLSFYEGGCAQVSRTSEGIQGVFSHLRQTFASEKTAFGFGEVGYTNSTCGESKRKQNGCAAKSATYIANYYDTMDKCLRKRIQGDEGKGPRYVGGYFYWWFLEDVVNVNNDVLSSAAKNFGGAECSKEDSPSALTLYLQRQRSQD